MTPQISTCQLSVGRMVSSERCVVCSIIPYDRLTFCIQGMELHRAGFGRFAWVSDTSFLSGDCYQPMMPTIRLYSFDPKGCQGDDPGAAPVSPIHLATFLLPLCDKDAFGSHSKSSHHRIVSLVLVRRPCRSPVLSMCQLRLRCIGSTSAS